MPVQQPAPVCGRRCPRRLVGITIIVLVLGRPAADATQAEPVDARQLDQAITAAVEYMIGACLDDGRFVYLAHLDPQQPLEPGYNILRHCGAIYALGMAGQREPNDETVATIRSSQRFVVDQCLRPVPGQSDMLAVWSDPAITGEEPLTAKLGGSGLGLAALLALGADESPATGDQLRGLGRFITFMQESDGQFVSRYVPSAGGKDRSWHSLYYPGEAALGLLMLYEADPDPAWVQAAADALARLARSRRGDRTPPADHWALLATQMLLPVLDRCERPVSRELLVEHAAAICTAMLIAKRQNAKFTPVPGCFTADGRVTPTATRLEGLLAALTFLPEEHADLKRRIEDEAAHSVAFLLQAQIGDGPCRGAFPGAIQQLPESHPMASESFNRRAGEIRIDYVQHALSALIQFEAAVLQFDPAVVPTPAGDP